MFSRGGKERVQPPSAGSVEAREIKFLGEEEEGWETPESPACLPVSLHASTPL